MFIQRNLMDSLVKWGFVKPSKFYVTSGVRQGGLWSP